MNTESIVIPDSTQQAPLTVKTTPKPCAHPIRLSEILVPLDLSKMSTKALQYAVSFAAQYGATITLLHVIDPATITREIAPALMPAPRNLPSVENQLGEVRESLIPSSIETNIAVRYDTAAEGILDATAELKPDLIILATHGRTGLQRLFLGSTAEKVVRTASCPVLVVREDERDFA